MKDPTPAKLPEDLRLASEKSGIPVQRICSAVFTFKDEEERYFSLQKRNNLTQIESIKIKIALREILIRESLSAKHYNKVYNPHSGHVKQTWLRKIKEWFKS